MTEPMSVNAARLETDVVHGIASLSGRERDVLRMAAQGMTNGEIAARLDVTVHAIKFHLASVYRKLGVGNRTEAAVMYLRSGGID